MNSRGGVLLMTLILSSFLSALILLAADSLLHGSKVVGSLETSMELLYLAEAGLAHGQAFCKARGNDYFSQDRASQNDASGRDENGAVPEDPFERWIPFGRGRYYLEVHAFSQEGRSTPYLARDSGILIVATAAIGEMRTREVCLLLSDPPGFEYLAWWEPGQS